MNFNLESAYKGNSKNEKILNSVFQLRKIQDHPLFEEFNKKIIKDFKITSSWDLDMFLSFAPGASGNVHSDEYEVLILNVLGIQCYKHGNENYILKPGDLISFKRGEPHQAIGIDPRISLSFGYGF